MTSIDPHSPQHYSVTLTQLELSISLGWTEEERAVPQVVYLDMDIRFKTQPKACLTDDLTDTCCYDKLIHLLKKNIHGKSFRLLEHLGHTIYQTVKQHLSFPAAINIHLKKYPAIPSLVGGVTFHYGDG